MTASATVLKASVIDEINSTEIKTEQPESNVSDMKLTSTVVSKEAMNTDEVSAEFNEKMHMESSTVPTKPTMLTDVSLMTSTTSGQEADVSTSSDISSTTDFTTLSEDSTKTNGLELSEAAMSINFDST